MVTIEKYYSLSDECIISAGSSNGKELHIEFILNNDTAFRLAFINIHEFKKFKHHLNNMMESLIIGIDNK